MSEKDTISTYFRALGSADGALAASLFAEDGVIDDFRGRRHRGREAIEAFLSNVPAMDLDILPGIYETPPRFAAYGTLTHHGKSPRSVRWVFTFEAGKIAHVVNSDIEFMPADLG